MLELGAALAAQVSVGAVAEMLARAVDRLVECAGISVWLRSDDRMELAAHVGYTPARGGPPRGRPRSPPTSRRSPATSTRATCSCWMPTTPRRSRRARDCPGYGASYALVPIGERAGNRAAIVVQRGRRRGPPSSRDERMLLGIADQALLAIDNRSLVDELEESFLATMRSLANALETKDEYTGDHAQALVGMAEEVARRLELGDIALRDVGVAAALHDVGQDRDPGVDPRQARAAHRRRVGGHAPPPGAGRADHGAGAGAGRGALDRPRMPRALGRLGISARAGRRRHPARGPHHPRLRRVPRDDVRPRLPAGDAGRCCDHRATRLRGPPLRAPSRRRAGRVSSGTGTPA